MIDTHAHLNTEAFDHKIDEVLQNAKNSGISKIIVIGMDEETNKKAIKLADQHDMLYASVGLHPSYVDQPFDFSKLEVQLNHPKVVAVGECGTDLYWRQDNFDLQKQVFIKQIEIAIKHDMPLIIHMRNSFKETFDLIKPYKGRVRGVFHCFSSNLEDALKVIDFGFYIGFDGPITYKNAIEARKIVEVVDLKHLLIETDSPYLAPMPYRGKENQPAYVIEVAKMIATLKNIKFEEVVKQTTLNAKKLFNL